MCFEIHYPRNIHAAIARSEIATVAVCRVDQTLLKRPETQTYQGCPIAALDRLSSGLSRLNDRIIAAWHTHAIHSAPDSATDVESPGTEAYVDGAAATPPPPTLAGLAVLVH